MTSPRWLTALHKTLSEHDRINVIQVATVDAEGAPRVRTQGYCGTVIPKSHPSLPLLLAATDYRTPKVTELTKNQRSEICWWIPPTNEQFRISAVTYIIAAPQYGFVTSVGPGMQAIIGESAFDWEKKRREVFESLPAPIKASYLRPAPGSAIEAEGEANKTSVETAPKLEEGLNNFALVVFEPVKVDYVEFGINPHRRTVFTRNEDNEWTERNVVP
ncbi:hypothetical protein NEOLEDRAFT_1096275 [Neolentinus lepideus HHB14362 ss-1]|uniref:Pyridoxamine 5'-phosphate oxidase Alr4036 family FMN-binding domain-containing protein n=1 Tax=Neolentinus lepideus HHB14362 ss-1 TaxID=1314782 RepID=A0A165R485_9AGAM|nr:hypothetical protein NEOLEDRAFT_1096275 [Neolentinus lepideus HHB14362 ss-1]